MAIKRNRLQEFKGNLKGLNALYDDAARKLGLTRAGMDILIYLCEKEGQGIVTQKMICEELSLSKQTVNTIIKSFIKQGIIKLKAMPEDKRNKALTSTDKGKAIYESARFGILDAEKNAFERLTKEQQDALLESVELFRENLYVCLLLQ